MNDSGKWTPELWLQLLKEVVAALMGLAVVGFTLVLAMTALNKYVTDATQMSNAKDILLLVLGPAGVVIGYYFGRVPADARAAQANQTAQQATVAAVSAADQIDDVLADTAGAEGAAGRGDTAAAAAANAAAVAELRRVRDNLRSAARR